MKGSNHIATDRHRGTGWLIFLFPLFLLSCNHPDNRSVLYSDTLVFSRDTGVVATESRDLSATEDNGIYYGIYSPAEVSGIFSRKNISYDPDILSPTKNINVFNTRTAIALNLGIYGADLSYIQMFGSADAAGYLDVILGLAGQLGIPPEYIRNMARRVDKNLENSDSLMQVALEAYNHINTFLIQENQEDIAYLILAGAWIEAMYIAAHDLLGDNDPEMVKKIIEQKYSLNFLLSSMKNYYNDTNVAYVYRRLFVLKKYLEKTEIVFRDQDITIDKDHKEIQASPESIRFSPETLKNIKTIIFELRKQILNK